MADWRSSVLSALIVIQLCIILTVEAGIRYIANDMPYDTNGTDHHRFRPNENHIKADESKNRGMIHNNRIVQLPPTNLQPHPKVEKDKLSSMVAKVGSDLHELQGEMRSLKTLNYLVYRTVKKLRSQLSNKDRAKNRCPRNFVWNPSSRSCYQLVGERTTWKDARGRCQRMGADLVSVSSRRDQMFIRNAAMASRELKHCDFWTGATDAEHEGRWVWVRTGKPVSFTYWEYGEPNNVNGIEHCMKMMWVFNWLWNDAHCNVNNACFVCEANRL